MTETANQNDDNLYNDGIPTPENFGERLQLALDLNRMSQRKLAENLNVSPTYTSQWCSNKVRPHTGNIEKIAECLKISSKWLASGTGPRDLEVLNAHRTVDIPECTIFLDTELKPVFTETGKTRPYPMSYFQTHGVKPENCRLTRALGDNMDPLIRDNDLILIDLAAASAPLRSGRIYVIACEGQVLVKRLYKFINRMELHNENPRYQTETIQNDKIQIMGYVLERSGDVNN